MRRASLTCFKDFLIHTLQNFIIVPKMIPSGRHCSLSWSVSEPPVIGFVRTGSPAVAVAWPVPIESRNKCNHVSSSYNKHARPLCRRAKEERRPRCVQGEPFSVRADVAYLRALRRRFAPARVKSVLLPVPREIPLDMYSAHISLVSCGIYAPFLFPVSTQLCILIGARGLLSRWFIDRGA